MCEVDSASAPQFDWTRGPRMVTNELPRFVSAAFSGATWLNWTEERQPTKPLAAACMTSSLKVSLPVKTRWNIYNFPHHSNGKMDGRQKTTQNTFENVTQALTGDFAQCQGSD